MNVKCVPYYSTVCMYVCRSSVHRRVGKEGEGEPKRKGKGKGRDEMKY